ncbi:unnamed protein product [Moneuplotes crassus]|uniref:Mitochondrial import inner membrane translocase subunit TIM14 n=1 Tax=Euplotes crassus TaxID=5936 RepID=A0AAD1Y631_EUPCR|nr:unnamed protein product [Moneuplotes crassus]
MKLFMLMGGGLLFTSIAGKSFIYFYRGVKNKNLFVKAAKVGRYHLGGFEPDMTRREASLILGVRESSQEKKILDAHKKLMMRNHPDVGGSAYISTKINEAKEMLMKGK